MAATRGARTVVHDVEGLRVAVLGEVGIGGRTSRRHHIARLFLRGNVGTAVCVVFVQVALEHLPRSRHSTYAAVMRTSVRVARSHRVVKAGRILFGMPTQKDKHPCAGSLD